MIKADLKELRACFEHKLEASFSYENFSKDLGQALVYALKGPAKRLRPLIVLASAHAQKLVAQAFAYAMPAALAIEYVHTYSLIHDDLPAMDNDDYRRGKPSLHRQFNQAVAILAGDALLADAFGFIAHAKINAALLCQELSQSAGRHNLVSGQAEDLASHNKILSRDQRLAINAKKTARLFEASAVMGALSVGTCGPQLKNLRDFGHSFGMAFQLKDDLEDDENLYKASKELMLAYQEKAHQAALCSQDPALLIDLLKQAFL